ncbi:MAG: exodeoxyribonuclease VII large subunit [Lewinellaceae bacterium]|nr:exodeoxyribonuclease VII large subunit [Lewinellaceae bacterium]
MPTYSLFDLQEYIRRVLALNFSGTLWVTAEVAQVSPSRGHLFVELVQKGPEADSPLVAQVSAVLWQRDYQRLRLALGNVLDELLADGREVRLEVRVDYHERYGLKLVITDADPAFTFGRLELQRRQTIETLREQGLLGKNRALPLPRVLQQIAVISSEGAAGFQDFREQLTQNAFGYAFQCRFFSSAVQGDRLESEMLAALDAVAMQAGRFDVVVILRGGGARLDLAGFDSPALCQRAANLPIPLFTGIGHDMDETVLDLVAWSALKTPTAVADFLVQHNLFFENEILRLAGQTRDTALGRLKRNALELAQLETTTHWAVQTQLRQASQQLATLETALPNLLRQRLLRANTQLDQAEALCAALHPDAVLRRGFSITRQAGKVVTGVEDVRAGDVLETQLKDGTLVSEIRGKS